MKPIRRDLLANHTFLELDFCPAEYRALQTKMAIDALEARQMSNAVIAGLLGLTMEELVSRRAPIEVMPGRRIEARLGEESKCGQSFTRGRISLILTATRIYTSLEEIMQIEGVTRKEAQRILDQQPPPPTTTASSRS